MRINEFDDDYIIEWVDIDRFFRGIGLYEINKSNMIVFTGGNNPYNKTKITEGEVLEKFALKLWGKKRGYFNYKRCFKYI